jgi:hypothetical protein
MGHALDEMDRVLKPGGYIVDIRPYRPEGTGNKRVYRPRIICPGSEPSFQVGALKQNPSDFRYSDQLMAEELRRGNRYKLIAHQHFYVSWYAKSYEIFDSFLTTEWQSLALGLADRHRLKTLHGSGPDSPIRIDMPVQINILKKLTSVADLQDA